MISFKQFLSEAKTAPLYHATHVDNMLSILKKGFRGETFQSIYRGNNIATKGVYGVSFSRSIRKAITYMSTHFMGNFDEGGFVVFEVSQEKIAHRYKVKPVDYFGTSELTGLNPFLGLRRSEDEEFVYAPRAWVKDGDVVYSTWGNISPDVIVAVHYLDDEYNRLSSMGIAQKQYPHIKWIAHKNTSDLLRNVNGTVRRRGH